MSSDYGYRIAPGRIYLGRNDPQGCQEDITISSLLTPVELGYDKLTINPLSMPRHFTLNFVLDFFCDRKNGPIF